MKITNVNDYVDELWELHPELSRDEIKRILVYGWKMIILYVSAGRSIHFFINKMFFFIGRIPSSPLATFNCYRKLLADRIAYMFHRTRAEWDGYYYFTRSERLYQEYLALKRKKKKVFRDVFLYKILEQVRIKECYNPYVFRLDEDKTERRLKYYKEIRTDKAELIEIRDPLRMEDLLTSLNKFKYLLK